MPFDKDAFLNGTVTEAGSTDYTPVPNHEWAGRIKKVDYREAGDSHLLDLQWGIPGDQLGPDGTSLESITGMKEATVRQSFFLDLTGNGSLDMGKGKNVKLNQLREALGQNNPGSAWSPRMLEGQAARITTNARTDSNSGRTYVDVKSATKL